MTTSNIVTSLSAVKDYVGQSNRVAFIFLTTPSLESCEFGSLTPNSLKQQLVGCAFSARVGTGIYVPLQRKH